MRVLVVHGYTSHCNAEWFPWLKEKLEGEGIQVIIPEMPNSDAPVLEKWLSCLDNVIPNLDENTILVGHSLGCITLIRYLLKQNRRVRGIILVSGFIGENPMKIQTNELSEFTKEEIDVDRLQKLADTRITITAENDNIVPTNATQSMAKKINSELIVLREGKHFIAMDGYTSFPLVYEKIKKLI